MSIGSTYTVALQSTLDIAIYAAFLTVLTVPMTVILNRYVCPPAFADFITPLHKVRLSAITTPHKLPWFAPLRSLQILLTPTEFSKPWKIYLAPGLIPARMIHVLWLVVIQRTVRSLLLPSLVPAGNIGGGKTGDERVYNPFANVNIFALFAYIIFVVLSCIFVVTPLEVMTTRLTIQVRTLRPPRFLLDHPKIDFLQRNNEPGFSTVPQEENPDIEYAGRDEDVIALRPEDNPYEGLKHCGLSILEEEGYRALFRAWWVTVIAGILTAFS